VKGKVLRLKGGYNPNSSSIGADAIVFFMSFAALSAAVNTVGVFLNAQLTDHQKSEGTDEEKKS